MGCGVIGLLCHWVAVEPQVDAALLPALQRLSFNPYAPELPAACATQGPWSMFLDQKTPCLYWINGDAGDTQYALPLDWLSSEVVLPFLAILVGLSGRVFTFSRPPLLPRS